jgi:hypothetical protein
MLLNCKCGLLGATAAVDMTLLREISSSQRVQSPAFRSLDWRGNTT